MSKQHPSIRLWHLTIPVVEDQALADEETHGQIDFFPRPTIILAPGLHPSLRATTLFHEAIHAIDWVWGLDLTEEQTRALEIGIIGLLKQNPALRRALMRNAAEG